MWTGAQTHPVAVVLAVGLAAVLAAVAGVGRADRGCAAVTARLIRRRGALPQSRRDGRTALRLLSCSTPTQLAATRDALHRRSHTWGVLDCPPPDLRKPHAM